MSRESYLIAKQQYFTHISSRVLKSEQQALELNFYICQPCKACAARRERTEISLAHVSLIGVVTSCHLQLGQCQNTLMDVKIHWWCQLRWRGRDVHLEENKCFHFAVSSNPNFSPCTLGSQQKAPTLCRYLQGFNVACVTFGVEDISGEIKGLDLALSSVWANTKKGY